MSAPFEREGGSDLYALLAVTLVLRAHPDLRLKDGVPLEASDVPERLHIAAGNLVAARVGNTWPSPAEHAAHLDAVVIAVATLTGALKRPALSVDLPGKSLLEELAIAYRAMRGEARLASGATGDTVDADELATRRLAVLNATLLDLRAAARWHSARVERVTIAARRFRNPRLDGDPDPVLRNFVRDVAQAFRDGFEVRQTRADEDAIAVNVPADARGPLARGENIMEWWEAPIATADADSPFMALLATLHDEARADTERRYGRGAPWPAITSDDVRRILAEDH